jgi:hypothetical protein
MISKNGRGTPPSASGRQLPIVLDGNVRGRIGPPPRNGLTLLNVDDFQVYTDASLKYGLSVKTSFA